MAFKKAVIVRMEQELKERGGTIVSIKFTIDMTDDTIAETRQIKINLVGGDLSKVLAAPDFGAAVLAFLKPAIKTEYDKWVKEKPEKPVSLSRDMIVKTLGTDTITDLTVAKK